MTLDDEIRRGELAQALLENDLLNETFSEIRGVQVDKWLKSGPDAVESRESIWRFAKTLDLVRAYLISVRDAGTMARSAVEQQKRDETFARLNDVP